MQGFLESVAANVRRVGELFNPSVSEAYWLFTDFYTVGAKVKFDKSMVITDYVTLPPTTLQDENNLVGAKCKEWAKSQYIHGTCGVHTRSQFFHKIRLEIKNKRTDSSFLVDAARERFKIDHSTHAIAALVPNVGREYDENRDMQSKDFVLCGALSQSFAIWQDRLITHGVYPDSLELGTVATIGALAHYLRAQNNKSPVLFIEPGFEHSTVAIVSNNGVELTHANVPGLDSVLPTFVADLKINDINTARRNIISGAVTPDGLTGNPFDKICKDIKSCLGFFEMQSGTAVNTVMIYPLHKNLKWMAELITSTLELTTFEINYQDWLKAANIVVAPNAQLTLTKDDWVPFGLMALMDRMVE